MWIEVLLDQWQQKLVLGFAPQHGFQVELREARCESLTRKDKADNNKNEQDIKPTVDLAHLHVECTQGDHEERDEGYENEREWHTDLSNVDTCTFHSDHLNLLVVDSSSWSVQSIS